ncbi:hypothetical protein WN55_00202 [Dufourea novaeangliae]|uniref:Uncharacterized protein n=1 Tax=Dufourea novaeangliae TaxID=178035 RepID=A0A154PE95_DUFNO|nr:hypothetical protein WN55_00202 [Dufourea novaeangliae]
MRRELLPDQLSRHKSTEELPPRVNESSTWARAQRKMAERYTASWFSLRALSSPRSRPLQFCPDFYLLRRRSVLFTPL